MGGLHAGTDSLVVHRHSLVHRLPPECKIAAALAFVLAVVATPREQFWPYGVHLVIVVTVAGLAGVRPALLVRRARIELPFIAFAVFLPIVGTDPRVDVAGLSLSRAGLWAAWAIVAKGTLGVLTSIVLAATTPIADLLRGLARLRVPAVLVAIAGFMVRYLGVIVGESQRMQIARLSRADNPRWLWQARGVATSAGTLFIRSFERGERVRLAMLARGFDGTMPDLEDRSTVWQDWLAAAVVPAIATTVALVAWGTQ